MSEKQREGFEGYAILELLGHRRLAGYVREAEIAGAGMIRIDVPAFELNVVIDEGSFTQYVSPQSVYALTPCTREVALTIAREQTPQPVSSWDVRALLPEIRESVRAEIESDVRKQAWEKQRQVTNIYTAGEDDYEEEDIPL